MALAIKITKGDLGMDRIFSVLEGALIRTSFKSNKDLADTTGGGTEPLVLLGHANSVNFVVDCSGYSEYMSGEDVAKDLVQRRNLKPVTFGFALLAECKGAEQSKRGGLFVAVGNVLGIPVLGSTTVVSMGKSGSNVTFTPQDKGVWKVYVPTEKTVYRLDAERFSGDGGFKQKLAKVYIVLKDK